MPEIKDKEKVKIPKIEIKDESEIYRLGADLYKRFTCWRDKKRSIEDQWLKNLRHYNSVYDTQTLAKIGTNGSAQFIGITRMKTTAAYASLVNIFFPANGHKFWAVKPTPYPTLSKKEWKEEELINPETNEPMPEEIVINETTNRMENRIHDQLIEAGADTLIRAAIKDACVYGSGIIKAGTVRVITKDIWIQGPVEWEATKEDDIVPDIDQPSPFDVYFDINATSPESSIGTYQRHILNKEEVRSLKLRNGFREEMIDELIKDYPNGNHNREHHEIERQSLGNITAFDNTGYYEVLEYSGYVDGRDLLNAGMDVKEEQLTEGYKASVWLSAHKVLAIIIDDSVNKGTRYFVFPYEQVSNQLWGVGVPEIMYDSQEVLNAAFRRMLDDMAMTGNQLEINVDRLDDRSVQNANKITPWKIWYRRGGDEAYNAITIHKVPSVTGELTAIIEMVRSFIDDETNLPSLISGQPVQVGGAGSETLGGMSMLMGAAQVVIKSVVKNIDDFLVRPLIKSYYKFNMEWARDETIKGDMNVHALGSSILIAKEVQNKNMIDFLSITANEFDMPLIRRPQILRRIASNMGFEPEDVVRTDKEVQKANATPDPMEEKLKELAIEKAQLENAEIQGRIDVLASEERKNDAESKYKQEFLRQRRIKLAEDIKEQRRQNKKDVEGDDEKKKSKDATKPVKILNE